MIAGKIKHLYPNADIGPTESSDVVLSSVNGVVRIERWNATKLGPQPDMSVLEAVSNTDGKAAWDDELKNKRLGKKDRAILATIAAFTGATEAGVLAQFETFFKR